MLRYCAWCGRFQGATSGQGHQIRKGVCEIDTLTICPPCLAGVVEQNHESHASSPRPRTERS